MRLPLTLLIALAFSGSAVADQVPETPVLTGPNFQQVPASDILVLPTGGALQTLGDALAAPTGNVSNATVTATGGNTSLTLASEFGYRLTVVDFGVDPTGVVDAGATVSAWMTGRTGLGGNVQSRFPKGTYTFNSLVDPKGRTPTWVVDWDANLNAYNLAGNSGWVVRPRRTNAWTFGTYDNATGSSVIANAPYDQPAQVSGFTGSGIANFSSRDSVALYTSNNAPAANTVASANYTGTTMVPSVAVDVTKLQVGMIIDTQHATKYSGFITGWAADGSSVTVSAWYQQGNTGAGQVPSNGTGAYINPITSIWAANSVTFLNSNSSSSISIGYEMDTFNNKSAYVDNINPAAASQYAWGYYALAEGTYASAIAYYQAGWYYDGFRSRDAQNSAFRVTSGGTRNPTYGFLYDVNSYNTAFAARNATTSNIWFDVKNGTTMDLGDGSGAFNINFFGEQSGGVPVRDAQIFGQSGGVLSLRANAIQLSNSVNNAVMTFAAGGSAVNFFQAVGTATGTAPSLTATGSDTNVSLNLATKGSGVLQINGTAGVNCAAGTVNTATMVITAGIVTHC